MSNEKLQDLSVLFEGMDVSDEQKEKFQTNLEAILSEKMSAYKAEVESENEKAIAEKVESEVANITDQVDEYLTYVVESWAEKNELAIETGIKLEIMESFIDGMKDLFSEHYIDIPEGADDAIAVSESKISELQSDLNEEIEKNMAMKKELQEMKKTKIIKEATTDLAETQKEKFDSLIEDIEYSDAESYARKIKTIRESFFKSDTTNADHEKDTTPAGTVDDRMSAYLSAL